MPRATKRSRGRYGRGRPTKRARGGPKKRRNRNRPRAKRTFGKENRMMAIPSAVYTPVTQLRKFVYDLTIDLSPTTNGGLQANQWCQFLISANNINLPFQGALLHPAVTPTYQGRGTGVPTDSCPGIGRWLGGTQGAVAPPEKGQPQATAPYAKYVVVGSKCSATWVPTSKSQQTAGVGVQTNICPYILSVADYQEAPQSNYWGPVNTQPSINVDHLRGVRGAKIKNLVNVNGITANAQQCYITATQSPKKVLGVVDLRDDDNAIGTIAAGPTKTTLYRVGIANRVYDDLSVHGLAGLLMRIRVEYSTLLYAPTAWTQNATTVAPASGTPLPNLETSV